MLPDEEERPLFSEGALPVPGRALDPHPPLDVPPPQEELPLVVVGWLLLELPQEELLWLPPQDELLWLPPHDPPPPPKDRPPPPPPRAKPTPGQQSNTAIIPTSSMSSIRVCMS